MARKPVLVGGKRDEIIQAATQLFLEKGYESTSVRDVLAVVGGEIGMFYHYFKSKDELFQVVAQKFFADYKKAVSEIIEKSPELPSFIDSFLPYYKSDIKKYFSLFQNLHWTLRMAFMEGLCEQLKEPVTAFLKRLDGKADVALDVLANQFVYGLNGTIRTESFEKMSDKEKKSVLLDFLNGIISQENVQVVEKIIEKVVEKEVFVNAGANGDANADDSPADAKSASSEKSAGAKSAPSATIVAPSSAAGQVKYSRCGMRCDLCLMYRPNVEKEDRRLELAAVFHKISPKWNPSIDTLICDGCDPVTPGAMQFSSACKARDCVKQHGIEHCGYCKEYEGCKTFPAELSHEALVQKIDVEKKWTWEDEALMYCNNCKQFMDAFRKEHGIK